MQALWQKIAEILRLSRLEKRWQRIARVLGIAVVFCTTYMLILPALTMENETYCGLQEHTHGDSCYAVATFTDAVSSQSTEDGFVCGLQEHSHNEICLIEELANAYYADNGEGDKHIHSEECYTADETLACTEWVKLVPWGLDRESEEFREQAIKYVSALINRIPDAVEFEEKLERFDIAGDYNGYETYYKAVYDIASAAWVNYENLEDNIRELIPNREHLLEYEWLYSSVATMAVKQTRTVEFVNYYNGSTTYKTVLIHSNNVGYYSSFGFKWWYAVVVDENEYGELVVTAMYDFSLADKSSLEPSTANGFVLLSHAESNKFTCSVGDEVTVNFDYMNTAAGSNLNSYGTVTFSDYEPPAVETEEDLEWYKDTAEESDSQVVDGGGRITSADKNVITTKTINGTSEENVFDITLTVQTQSNIQSFLDEPDMAVVVVMDISNSMNSDFGSTTRYYAARNAAANFITQFAENTDGLSQIGFIAFNTHVHDIFELQPCSTEAQANALISEMQTDTANIALASGYASSKSRFTNVEGGLAIGYEMLKKSGNANQYIILLSDGFPTTYVKDGYTGYEPFSSSGTPGTDGVFYDNIRKSYCTGGTSYSDPAAIKARVKATEIKDSGAKIFSIGIDIGGQTVQGHIDAGGSPSIVDRMYSTYEVGSATDKNAYKTWLQYSVGSGQETVTVKDADGNETQKVIDYYHDSENSTQLSTAFNNIFDAITYLNETSTKTVWTATDPMPVYEEEPGVVGFIHFYDKDGNVVGAPDPETVTGTHTEGGENTAEHEGNTILWDLKKSGYTSKTEGTVTTYYYSLKYRVRLVNEKVTQNPFEDGKTYSTNGDAYLEYRSVTTTNDVQQVSDLKNVNFSKPAVVGYLSEFSFSKVNSVGEYLPGAVFTLAHDDSACTLCHGDGTALTNNKAHDETYLQEHYAHTIGPYQAVSDSEGNVSFSSIPSGHTYTLTETSAPSGYKVGKSTYSVVVAYDELSVYETKDGVTKKWNGINDTVTNYGYTLPETGGTGTTNIYIIGGLLIATSTVFLLCIYRNNRERRRKSSKA